MSLSIEKSLMQQYPLSKIRQVFRVNSSAKQKQHFRKNSICHIGNGCLVDRYSYLH